jgi:hypothetical protein
MPNWPPAVPSLVRMAVMVIQLVVPAGSEIDTCAPGSEMRADTLPLSVRTSTHFTGSPMAAALVVNRKSPARTGWSRSSRSHWPTARSAPLLTQPVAGSPSTAAAVELPGAEPPIWVASAAELDAVTVAPDHSPRTGSAPGTG